MILLALLGCTPLCPTFADMSVEDPDDLATDDELTQIITAISDFATWTGRDGVCVPGIEVELTFPLSRAPMSLASTVANIVRF